MGKKVTNETKAKIKASLQATKEKRKSQRPMVFELKIDYSHLSRSDKNRLHMMFLEAKWLYNHILSTKEPFKYDTKATEVIVLNKDRIPEQRKLRYLLAKTRQDIHKSTLSNIRGLSASKKNGNKIGKLKFKSEYNSIDLSQYDQTHKLVDKHYIKLNGFKKPIRVNGLRQINKDYEIANAKLIKKASGYYVNLTCYLNIKSHNLGHVKQMKPSIGIDMGIKTTVTTSDGDKYDISIRESEHLKRLQRKLSKQVKGSKNRWKTIIKIRREYEKLTNRRKDKVNKIVSHLLSCHQIICMQDENIKGWHKGWFGKQVQNSALGSIKSKLLLSKQVIIVNRFFPSTKKCYNCGNILNIGLDERTYICPICKLTEDRDIKSAKSILYEGLSSVNYVKVPVESRDFKPGEITPLPTAGAMASVVNELGSLRIYS